MAASRAGVALADASGASSYARHLRSNPGDASRDRAGGKGAPQGRLGKGIRPGLMQNELDRVRGQALASRAPSVGNAPLVDKGGKRGSTRLNSAPKWRARAVGSSSSHDGRDSGATLRVKQRHEKRSHEDRSHRRALARAAA